MSRANKLCLSASFLILLHSCADFSPHERHEIDASLLPGEYTGTLEFVIDQVNYQESGHVISITQGETDYWLLSFDSIHTLDSVYIITDIKFEIDQYSYLENHQSANIIFTGNPYFTGIESKSSWDATNTLGIDYRLNPREKRFTIGLESIQNTEGISEIRIYAEGIF